MGNITILRGGAIGDFILTLPAIDAIQKAFPANDLHLVGHPATLALGKAQSILDHNDPRLISLHRAGSIPQATSALFANTERVLAYTVDTEHQFERQLHQIIEGPVLLWDPRPPINAREHIIDHLLSPLQQWDIPISSSTPRITITSTDLHYVDSLPSAPQVIIHPGSSAPGKCWPEPHFRAVAATLRAKGWHAALLCGPIEIERGLAGDSIQPPDLRALVGLLSRATLFIGNDSGPGHIAAALGTPTLSLFGPTDPRIWAPRNAHGEILLAPSGIIGEIPLDTVVATALHMLGSADHG